ncbi:MAG TPA: ROK family transcriptional regulator [Lacisediminihabitans sp.]|uniref:ROK family transcriptional regulator n=1 Tax=Lacisediminihabitans sp. TaxID=2787631 RepID=UPI002EDAEED1
MTDLATPVNPAAVEAHSSNDFIRRRNLSAVLTSLHHGGPRSRADLVNETGLNRSTVTVLVAELMELGLVRDSGTRAATGRAGRPSSSIEVDPTVAAIAVYPDIEGVTVGLVGLGGEVLSRIRFDSASPLPAKKMVKAVSSLVDGMRADIERHYRVVGVGVAVPGLVRAGDGRVLLAPHLNWRNEPFTETLRQALGYPVITGNESSIGAMGEVVFGAARGARNLVYVNGTSAGVGGGIVIDGALLHGTEGYAGELGHTLVNSSGRRCYCGRTGCLEIEVSQSRLLPLLGRTRIDEDELDVELGVARDPAVLAEVSRQVELLSEALTDFVNLFNPEIVVLAGYLGALLSVSRERLTEAVRIRPLGGAGRAVRLERASLRSRLMLVGPAELAFGPVLRDPANFS